eukprot:CAMPEP_0194047996 /NCGR_PEP_ID=MMETSP0009_2-20130614/26499_1 /TAXON_ID=210454 /ORGANISM="Grammatophora oceanica, Strain CCMP 410" /LENGTH=82 /DNA_ID=CAMNT_0038693773 /DNA_START=132 /DNA_END=381 /DNA_ORIENTATION=+
MTTAKKKNGDGNLKANTMERTGATLPTDDDDAASTGDDKAKDEQTAEVGPTTKQPPAYKEPPRPLQQADMRDQILASSQKDV